MVAFKSLAEETSCLRPMFKQDEINLKIIMIFLLWAKIMNKVLLTSPVLNSYSLTVNFPGLSKRLNDTVGIHVFNSLNLVQLRNEEPIFLFCK